MWGLARVLDPEEWAPLSCQGQPAVAKTRASPIGRATKNLLVCAHGAWQRGCSASWASAWFYSRKG